MPGGKPDPGETFDATAVREVFEESGLNVTPSAVAGATDGYVPGVRVAMLVLEARTRSTNVRLSDEHDDFRWLPLDQVCSLKLRPGFDQFFAGYEARSKRRPTTKTGTK